MSARDPFRAKTDAQLRAEVMAELSSSPMVEVSRVAVDVREGVVTLLGTLPNGGQLRVAERAARRVEGVRALISEVKVVLPWGQCCDDASLARTVEHALRWVSSLPRVALQVRVQTGWITLSGEVAWDYQRQAAADVVRRQTGVAGVNNHLTLARPRPRS